MTEDEAKRILHGLSARAGREPSWRALAVVGSWARDAARDDSDLDLLILTDSIETWVADDAWLHASLATLGFSDATTALEDYGVAKSWRVSPAADVELELTFAPLIWAKTDPVDSGTRRVVRDGMVAVVDKDGLLRAIQEAVRAGA